MKLFLAFIFGLISVLTFAQPSNYYEQAEGKASTELYDALKVIITNGHQPLSYSGLWEAYKTTDKNASRKLWDMYSNCSFTLGSGQCGSYTSECDCYNREHSIPKSWFSSATPMYTDLVHVIPTDGFVNAKRSNYPLGVVSSVSYTSANGSKLGTSVLGYSGTVFEPINQYKGDFARIYFYMATRYADLCGSWSGAGATVFASKKDLGLSNYFKALYLSWHRNDPVSEKERSRNKGIYSFQGNCNPFVDHPELVEYIWGDKSGLKWNSGILLDPKPDVDTDTISQKYTIYPNPASEFILFSLEKGVSFYYCIYDITGIIQQEGWAISDEFIPLVAFKAGVYIFRVKTETESISKKITIQKK